MEETIRFIEKHIIDNAHDIRPSKKQANKLIITLKDPIEYFQGQKEPAKMSYHGRDIEIFFPFYNRGTIKRAMEGQFGFEYYGGQLILGDLQETNKIEMYVEKGLKNYVVTTLYPKGIKKVKPEPATDTE